MRDDLRQAAGWALALALIAGCAPGGAVVVRDPVGSEAPTETQDSDGPPATSDTGPEPTGDTDESSLPTDTAPPYDPLCRGEGPGSAALGSGGGPGSFVPLREGDPVPIVTGPSQRFGLTLALLTQGLDTAERVQTILRVEVSGHPTVFNSYLNLQCPQPGPGWASFHADFDEDLQERIGRGELDGAPAVLDLTVLDAAGDRAEQDLRVVLRGP